MGKAYRKPKPLVMGHYIWYAKLKLVHFLPLKMSDGSKIPNRLAGKCYEFDNKEEAAPTIKALNNYLKENGRYA